MDEMPARDPRDEASADEGVGPGRDSSRAEPGSEGVPPGDEREERLAAIRAAVARGIEDVRAGRVADLEAALDRIETLLDEIEAVKRG
jgi:antitoxin ParD1/3/4